MKQIKKKYKIVDTIQKGHKMRAPDKISHIYVYYNVRFSKGEFPNISSGMRDMILESNTFEKNSVRRTF